MVARLKEITDTIYELQSSRISGSEFNEPIQLGKKLKDVLTLFSR